MNTRFIIVDDDIINNIICSYTIGKLVNSTNINCFQYPTDGLNFILSEYGDENKQLQAFLFLDINMPDISGWDFLDEFAKMNGHIQNQISIYMLSSSVDPSEKERARTNPFVKGFLEKPLRAEEVSNLLLSQKQIFKKLKLNYFERIQERFLKLKLQ